MLCKLFSERVSRSAAVLAVTKLTGCLTLSSGRTAADDMRKMENSRYKGVSSCTECSGSQIFKHNRERSKCKKEITTESMPMKMKGLRGVEPLPAPARKERMQGVRRGEYLSTPAHTERCKEGGGEGSEPSMPVSFGACLRQQPCGTDAFVRNRQAPVPGPVTCFHYSKPTNQ
jgi:hypothetical protein